MSYRKKFNALSELRPKKRGLEFENLIRKMFDDSGCLVAGSYYTDGKKQQIDGAIEIKSRYFLLEVKWEKSETLAASKLYSFLGKINSKLNGTLGVFISYNSLSDNFIESVRDGIRQNCIIIHGKENIEDLVDSKVDIKEYVEYCYKMAALRDSITIDTSAFISLPKKEKGKEDTSPHEGDVTSSWKSIYEALVGSENLLDFGVLLSVVNVSELGISKKLLDIFPVLGKVRQSEKFVQLLDKCLKEDEITFSNEFVKKLNSDKWREFTYNSILKVVTGKLELNGEDKNQIIENVTGEFLGDFYLENDASEVIEIFYNSLTEEELKTLGLKYLDIYIDTVRQDGHPQKKLANKIFKDLKGNNVDLLKLLEKELLEILKDDKKRNIGWMEQGDSLEKVKKETIDSLCKKYKKIGQTETLKKLFEKEYDKS